MKTTDAYTDGSALYTWKGEIRYMKNTNKTSSTPADHAGIGVFYGDGDVRNVGEPFYIYPLTIRRAEIYAAIKAIETYVKFSKDKKKTRLVINTDDNTLYKTMTDWVEKWKKNGWRKYDGKQPANLDLIYWLYYLINLHKNNLKVDFKWVKAHRNKIPSKKSPEYKEWYGNDQADKLAKRGTTLAVFAEKK